MNLSGLKSSGCGKFFGSFIMKDKLAKNTDPAGNVKPSTSVAARVLWAKDNGATLATLCTSEMVA